MNTPLLSKDSIPLYEARLAKAEEFADYWKQQLEEHSDALARSASTSANAIKHEMQVKLGQIRDLSKTQESNSPYLLNPDYRAVALDPGPQDVIANEAHYAKNADSSVLNDTLPASETPSTADNDKEEFGAKAEPKKETVAKHSPKKETAKASTKKH